MEWFTDLIPFACEVSHEIIHVIEPFAIDPFSSAIVSMVQGFLSACAGI